MQVYTDDGLTDIDFASNSVLQTSALDDVADGSRRADQLPAELRAKVKDNLFVDWLQRIDRKAIPSNAIEWEQKEFILAIQNGNPVSVTGEHGYQALEVASRILDQIAINHPSRAIIPAAGRFGKTKAA